MSGAVKEAIGLMEVLPESEQNFALEFIKKTCSGMGSGFYQGYAGRTRPLTAEGKEDSLRNLKETG